MPYFNIVAETNENTVVTEYVPVKARSDSYQSEAELASTYGFPASSWEKYTDPLAFNASVSLTGNLAAFEYAFTSSRRIPFNSIKYPINFRR